MKTLDLEKNEKKTHYNSFFFIRYWSKHTFHFPSVGIQSSVTPNHVEYNVTWNSSPKLYIGVPANIVNKFSLNYIYWYTFIQM